MLKSPDSSSGPSVATATARPSQLASTGFALPLHGHDSTGCSSVDPHDTALVANRHAAARLAKRLYLLDGFSRVDVAKHLSKVNEFSQLVANEYVSFFELASVPLDRALRKFVQRCVIVGETQERERVLFHFARRYYECNAQSAGSVDAVHTLTCALMLLNVDLHGGKTTRKMQLNEFVHNLAGLNDGHDFGKELLKELYHNVKKEALPLGNDDSKTPTDVPDRPDSSIGNGASEASPRSGAGAHCGGNPYLDVPDSSKSGLYIHTVLMRKCVREPGGRKPPVGRRSWRLYYAALCDLVLYLFKSQEDFCSAFGLPNPNPNANSNASRNSRRTGRLALLRSTDAKDSETATSVQRSAVATVVRIHHALAEKALDYRKKEHVIRLWTADGAEFLFQAADGHQLLDWLWRINVLAARLSAPVLPGAVGSTCRFAARLQRPLLPSTVTRLSLVQQLNEHRKQLTVVNGELDQLLRSQQLTLSRVAGGKSKADSKLLLQEREERRKYLEFEQRRFGVYAHLLEKECEKELAQAACASESLLRQPISEDRENEEAATALALIATADCCETSNAPIFGVHIAEISQGNERTECSNGHQMYDLSTKPVAVLAPPEGTESPDASSLCRSGRGSLDNLSVSTSGSAPVMCSLSALASASRTGLPLRPSASHDDALALAELTDAHVKADAGASCS